MAELHTIYLFGRQAVCPACSGMITRNGATQFKCVDCHESFELVEQGMSDNEMVCRHIGKEGA